jgi:hypothetical protein
MSSSTIVRSLGIAFVFSLAACGNVALVNDAGADGAAGSGNGGGGATGNAGSTGSAGATGGSGGGGATGGTGGATGGGSGHAGATGSGGATGGSGGHAGAGGSTGGCICPAIYQPTCGTDGRTYGNACEANCAGVMVAHSGACADNVTLRLTVPANKSFCEQSSGCNGPPSHFTILADGKPVAISTPPCPTICSATCQSLACPLSCIAPHGSVVSGAEVKWDGTVYPMSTCGQGTSCYAPMHLPAGKYVARMCATPGALDPPDGGFNSTCVASGPAVCVDVPFELPSTSPVVGHLP